MSAMMRAILERRSGTDDSIRCISAAVCPLPVIPASLWRRRREQFALDVAAMRRGAERGDELLGYWA